MGGEELKPAWRDPWAWLAALAVVPLLIRSWGAPLGEPVAEDFDFLHVALFERSWHLLDGGGSDAYWRPLSLQLYYRAFAHLMLEHPAAMAALHAVALALAALFLTLAFRSVWSGPRACAAAVFPLLAESTRQLISWPDHSSDVGVFLFSALALFLASRRRLAGTLAALLAALLCKEIAVIAALLVPFMPAGGPRPKGERLRWIAAIGGLLLIWGLAAFQVRSHAHLLSPQALVGSTEPVPLPLRYLWALWVSVRAVWSLSLTWDARDRVAAGFVIAGVAIALILLARRDTRARFRSALPWIAWGGAWFLLASAAVTTIFPHWLPTRSQFGSVGLGVAAVAALDAAHPALVALLIAGRLALLGMSPGPATQVAENAPQSGAFVDFARLTRLQRLMRDTRAALAAKHPTLPAGATVVWHYFPHEAQYAFGGDRALQAWYRDSTLRWQSYSEYARDPDRRPAAIVEFEPERTPQAALVDPAAMRSMLLGAALVRRAQWDSARVAIDRAESLQSDPGAAVFLASVLAKRALYFVNFDSLAAAERDAQRALELWRENPDSRYVVAKVRIRQGRFAEAEAQLDTLIAQHPDDRGSVQLREVVRSSMRAPGLR